MISFSDESADDLIAEVRDFFSPTGAMAKAKNFEYRQEQQQMAVAVASALMGKKHLVVEAGTGVGKSLAYLVPAILFAKAQKKKAIISTYTINLQEQLVFKDLPIVEKLLPVEFDVMLWKGRGNYICPTRLERAMQHASELFDSPAQAELQRIWEWSQRTKDGTLSDLEVDPDPAVWQQVCSEAHLCTPKTCGTNPRCFYQAARKRLISADVVVTNHTLFFLMLSGREIEEGEEGYLFANDFVIFDEAHTVEGVASREIGMGVSQYGLRFAIQRLYNPKSQKGLFQVLRQPDAVREAGATLEAIEKFFGKAGERAEKLKPGRELRVREPDFVEDTITAQLAQLQTQIVRLVRSTEDETLKGELQDLGRRVRDARAGIVSFLRQEAEAHVYWIERTGKQQQWVNLHAAPVDIAGTLRHLLFREGATCVMTSATLSVGGENLDYFRSRVGAWDAEALAVGSPFDYPNQMRLFITKKMPDPRDDGYVAALAERIEHFIKMTKGRAFVLFTSYKMMEAVAAEMREVLDDLDYKLLVQGEGLTRHRLIAEFRKNDRHVLFGTESFWSGVDVPGDALSNVIITRLPFAVPDHPLIEARLEHLEAQGHDPFAEYSLPEAILKLRQGVGRLIRTKSDSGIVVILDPRVLTKNYGRAFLKALPQCPQEIV